MRHSDRIWNEQTKLMATFLNNCAVSSFVIGVLTPIFNPDVRYLSTFPIAALVLGGMMGVMAHGVLTHLVDEGPA